MANGQTTYNYSSEYGTDEPCANYDTSADIPANRIVLLDTSNQYGVNAVTGVALPVAAGGVAGTYGITVETLYAASSAGIRAGRVRTDGVMWVPANGPITAGDYVQASDTVAKLGWAKVAGAGIEQIGQALTSAADSEMVRIKICKARNA
jgi:hypothetical protein